MDDRDDIEDFFKKSFGTFGRFGANIWPTFYDNSSKSKQPNDIDPIDPVFDEHFRHFNKVFNEANQMMRNMSFAGSFSFGNRNQSFPGMIGFDETNTNENNANLRDSFLKKSNETKQVEPKESTSFFENFFNQQGDDSKLDNTRGMSDKDESINTKNEKVKTWSTSSSMMPQFFGMSQSSSYKRQVRPDGSVEEVKTIKYSNGREERIVTRIIGNKRHTVVEKKLNKNVEETEEFFQNFDEKNLDDFNNQWNNSRDASKNTKFQQDKKENFNAVIPETKKLDSSDNESFISKIFSWFK